MVKRRALITAATSSIGRVIAKTLHDAGYDLVLHYNISKDLVDQLTDELSATSFKADLSVQSEIEDFILQLSRLPKFDVIINNVGVASYEDAKDIASWERLLRINTIAPAVIMAHAKEFMNLRGVIINISSVYGDERFGEKGFEAYGASKAALNKITRMFAKELAPDIRVNAIAPGYVHSKWNKNYSEKELERFKKDLLIERFIEPQEIADLTLHIVKNAGLDGEIIYLDGGLTLKTV